MRSLGLQGYSIFCYAWSNQQTLPWRPCCRACGLSFAHLWCSWPLGVRWARSFPVKTRAETCMSTLIARRRSRGNHACAMALANRSDQCSVLPGWICAKEEFPDFQRCSALVCFECRNRPVSDSPVGSRSGSRSSQVQKMDLNYGLIHLPKDRAVRALLSSFSWFF